MTQFLGFTLFFVIVGGLALHSGFEFPWFLHWIGHLPGDLLIKKGTLTLYVPLTSSVLISILFSFIASLFSRR